MDHIRVDLPNTNNKLVGFGLANVDTFIIRVGFGLTNIDTIRILTRHEHDPSIRIATPTIVSLSTIKSYIKFVEQFIKYFTFLSNIFFKLRDMVLVASLLALIF